MVSVADINHQGENGGLGLKHGIRLTSTMHVKVQYCMAHILYIDNTAISALRVYMHIDVVGGIRGSFSVI